MSISNDWITTWFQGSLGAFQAFHSEFMEQAITIPTPHRPPTMRSAPASTHNSTLALDSISQHQYTMQLQNIAIKLYIKHFSKTDDAFINAYLAHIRLILSAYSQPQRRKQLVFKKPIYAIPDMLPLEQATHIESIVEEIIAANDQTNPTNNHSRKPSVQNASEPTQQPEHSQTHSSHQEPTPQSIALQIHQKIHSNKLQYAGVDDGKNAAAFIAKLDELASRLDNIQGILGKK